MATSTTCKPKLSSRLLRDFALWPSALLLTYFAGKLATDLAKWIILAFWAPTLQAKLLLVSYLAGSFFPVLIFAVAATLFWRRLLKRPHRPETLAVLVLELAVLTYLLVRDLPAALTAFLP